jgi:DNA-binding transcriptional LysR family regulator
MELRQLETFRVVMATLSMTEAARRVHLSPAAVSLQIKHLSEELAQTFLHGLAISWCRQQQQRGCINIWHRLWICCTLFVKIFPGSRMRLQAVRTGTGPTTLIYQLRQSLTHLRKQFPRNNILVHVGPTQDIIYELEWKQIDLGIVLSSCGVIGGAADTLI